MVDTLGLMVDSGSYRFTMGINDEIASEAAIIPLHSISSAQKLWFSGESWTLYGLGEGQLYGEENTSILA